MLAAGGDACCSGGECAWELAQAFPRETGVCDRNFPLGGEAARRRALRHDRVQQQGAIFLDVIVERDFAELLVDDDGVVACASVCPVIDLRALCIPGSEQAVRGEEVAVLERNRPFARVRRTLDLLRTRDSWEPALPAACSAANSSKSAAARASILSWQVVTRFHSPTSSEVD